MIDKIKNFLKKLFGLNNLHYLEAPKNDTSQEELKQNNIKLQSEFAKQIKIKPDEKKKLALRLQKNYKEGIIEEENLSEEEFDLLSNLYESQIESTKQSIENYRNKILNIQAKLAQNN